MKSQKIAHSQNFISRKNSEREQTEDQSSDNQIICNQIHKTQPS